MKKTIKELKEIRDKLDNEIKNLENEGSDDRYTTQRKSDKEFRITKSDFSNSEWNNPIKMPMIRVENISNPNSNNDFSISLNNELSGLWSTLDDLPTMDKGNYNIYLHIEKATT